MAIFDTFYLYPIDGDFPQVDSIASTKVKSDNVEKLIKKAMMQSLNISSLEDDDPSNEHSETDNIDHSTAGQEQIDTSGTLGPNDEMD